MLNESRRKDISLKAFYDVNFIISIVNIWSENHLKPSRHRGCTIQKLLIEIPYLCLDGTVILFVHCMLSLNDNVNLFVWYLFGTANLFVCSLCTRQSMFVCGIWKVLIFHLFYLFVFCLRMVLSFHFLFVWGLTVVRKYFLFVNFVWY